MVRVACACVTDGARVLAAQAPRRPPGRDLVAARGGRHRRAWRPARGRRRGGRRPPPACAPRSSITGAPSGTSSPTATSRPRSSASTSRAPGARGRTGAGWRSTGSADARGLQLHAQDGGARRCGAKTRQRPASVVERDVVRARGLRSFCLFAACAASGRPRPRCPGRTARASRCRRRWSRSRAGLRRPRPRNGPELPAGATNDPGGDADFAAAKARFDAGDARGGAPLAGGVRGAPRAAPGAPGGRSRCWRAWRSRAATPRPREGCSSPLDLAAARRGDGRQRPLLPRPGRHAPREVRPRARAAAAVPAAGRRRRAGRRRAGRAARRACRGDRRRRRSGGGDRAVGRLRARRPRRREGVRARADHRARREAVARARRCRRSARRRRRGSRGRCSGEAAASALRARGDSAGRGRVRVGDGADARRALGFDQPADRSGSARRSGAARAGAGAVGKFQPVGEAALRAAMLATGTPAAPAMQLCVRDAGGEPAASAASGRTSLVRDEAVIGIVAALAPRDARGDRAASAIPARGRCPDCWCWTTRPALPARPSRLLHSASARAAALAATALAARRARLRAGRPRQRRGDRAARAFKQAVVEGGGRVTADASYPPGSTSFTSVVAAIKKAQPQVVFVADGADRLELIAPALASADLWAAPWGAARPAAAPGKPRPRNVLLLSTAADLSPRLLQSAGRYVQGALLAPGFYAGADDPRAPRLRRRVPRGLRPGAARHRGVCLRRRERDPRRAGGRRQDARRLSRALADGTFEGLTGALHFGADRRARRPAARLRRRRRRHQALRADVATVRRGGRGCGVGAAQATVIAPGAAS